jgi:hypothetical protein
MTDQQRIEILEELVDDAFDIINGSIHAAAAEWLDRSIKYEDEMTRAKIASLREQFPSDEWVPSKYPRKHKKKKLD